MFAFRVEPFFLVVFAAVMFGSNIGSFLNVVVYRSPRQCVTINHPLKSFCPRCGRRLKWYENQPVLGWFLLRGRCGGCSLPISMRYLLVEVGVACIWVLAAYRCLESGRFYLLEGVFLALACSFLVAAALIDYDLRILPNFVTVPGMALMPFAAFLAPGLHRQSSLTATLTPLRESLNAGFGVGFLPGVVVEALVALIESLLASPFVRQWDGSLGSMSLSLAGMMVGAGILWAIRAGGRGLFGREVMGFGDVKLMGFIGALLGPRGALVVLGLASLFGSVVGLLLKFASGTGVVSQSRFAFQLGLIPRVLLAPFGAEMFLEKGVVKRRYRGFGGMIARFLGGDDTLAFGPYLAAAGLFVALCPLPWIDRVVRFFVV